MATFPDPPPVKSLTSINPIIYTIKKGTKLYRIYFRSGPHPTTWNQFRSFGPTGTRFDHHTYPSRIQKRAIIYPAIDGVTCLAEVFQATRFIDRRRNDPWLAGFSLLDNLRLLDLTGLWPTQAGISMAINSGSHARARKWSRAIYSAYPDVQGLFYCSSMHQNNPALALYERAKHALPHRPSFNRALNDPVLHTVLLNAAYTLNYGFF